MEVSDSKAEKTEDRREKYRKGTVEISTVKELASKKKDQSISLCLLALNCSINSRACKTNNSFQTSCYVPF